MGRARRPYETSLATHPNNTRQASAVLLMVNREAHAARALALGRRLLAHLSDGDGSIADYGSESRVLADQLAGLLLTRRAHIQPAEAAAAAAATYDPRLLVFEFSTGFVLRAQQVELVGKLVSSTLAGGSVCHQMLMGEGKTTVVSPLLALLLGDSALVVQAGLKPAHRPLHAPPRTTTRHHAPPCR